MTESHSNIEYSKVSNALLNLIETIEDDNNNKEDIKVDKTPTIELNSEKLVDVVLTIDRNFEDYSHTDKEKLFLTISSLLEIGVTDIVIKSVNKGSVKITISIPRLKVDRLFLLIKNGSLSDHDVVKCEFLKLIRIASIDKYHDFIDSNSKKLKKKLDFINIETKYSFSSSLRHLQKVVPEIVIIDFNSKIADGIHFVRLLKSTIPKTSVLILTTSTDEKDIFDALKVGASGYLTKPIDEQELAKSIIDLKNGGSPMSPDAVNVFMSLFSMVASPKSSKQVEILSSREKQALERLSKGYSNKEIAVELNIKEVTVKQHVNNIYKKLHASDGNEAVAKYLKKHL